ncbi:MAG: hypothetical protein MMC33_006275 [Icmadophila ericetorum]|nr:hypothetical protein [Icmadophila ericetorum]
MAGFGGLSGKMDPIVLARTGQDAQQQSYFFIYASTALGAAATIAVVLRILARWRLRRASGTDDIWISLSLIPLWSLVGCGIILALKGGMGMPSQLLSSSQSTVFTKILFASWILYGLSITTVKISVLLLYCRMFMLRSFQYSTYAVGSLCLIWFLIILLVSFFECRPIAVAWDSSVSGKCIDLTSLYYGLTISNVILDVVINLMPVKMVWKLQLPLRQRLFVLCVMGLGIIIVTASVGRIGSVPNLVQSEKSGQYSYLLACRSQRFDFSEATIFLPFLYSIVEPAFATICACLPMYQPLFLWLVDAFNSLFGKAKVRRSSEDTTNKTAPFLTFKKGTRPPLVWRSSGNSFISKDQWPLSSPVEKSLEKTQELQKSVELYLESPDRKRYPSIIIVPPSRMSTPLPSPRPLGYDANWAKVIHAHAYGDKTIFKDDDLHDLYFPSFNRDLMSPV